MPPAIGIGLPDSNIPGDDAFGADLCLIVVDLWMGRIAQVASVDKGEMRHIQKVLHSSRAAGLILVGATVDFAEFRIIPLREEGNVVFRIAQCYPYPVVPFLRLIDFGARFLWRRLVRMCWETDAV